MRSDELIRIWKEEAIAYRRNYFSICAEGLGKTVNRSHWVLVVSEHRNSLPLSRALRCLFWAGLIHSTCHYHFYKRFVVTFRLCLSQPSDLFPTDSPDRNSVRISLEHPCLLHAAPILISLICSLWRVQITKLLIMQTSYQLLTSNYVAVQGMYELEAEEDHEKYV
jgi:hypothetical protein